MIAASEWGRNARTASRRSAPVLARLIDERFAPDTVLDVGCGEGHLVAAFTDRGVVTEGLDGPTVNATHTVDLAAPPYPALGPYSVVTCLEVAEHLPANVADRFVAWLVSLAPTVVFSAAIPGQRGTRHINEQWPAYWVQKFAWHGYTGSGAFRWTIWDDDLVAPWYRQNLCVYGALRGLAADGCPAVVHPALWPHSPG